MTAENRRFITLDEITHLEFHGKNKNCGASLLIPISDKQFVSHRGPHCKALWFQQESSVEKAVMNLKYSVAILMAEGQAVGFVLRMEIKPEDDR
ncbi:MAG: hypothetical protein ACRD3T_12565 [Terriglobia bacterium]